jgi:stage IV sporulation protein FB
MSWSLNIGKVAGTVVRVHLTFLLFLAWIFAASYASGGAATAWDSLVFMVLLFLCVLLHEFGHIFTARAFNVPTPYVTLLPIGGVAQLERIPEEPWEEFLIAIAGPMVNIAIMAVLIVLFGAHLQPSAAAAVDNLKIPLVDRLAAVNLVSRAVQYDTGVSDGWRPRSARFARHSSWLCARNRNCRRASGNLSPSRSDSSVCCSIRS